MKHYIIAKFKPEIVDKQALMPRIRKIFSAATDIDGVYGAEVYENCIQRDNRFDIMIVIDMDTEALPLYDNSRMHHQWKDEFGAMLSSKAIFDQI